MYITNLLSSIGQSVGADANHQSDTESQSNVPDSAQSLKYNTQSLITTSFHSRYADRTELFGAKAE